MAHALEYETPHSKRGPLLIAHLTLLGVVGVAYLMAFGSKGGFGAIGLFFPFTMLPFVFNGLLAWFFRSTMAQSLVLIATLGYAAWFAYVFVNVTYLHPDPQGPIAFLFVGIFASPALALLWGLSWLCEYRSQRTSPDVSQH